MKFFLEVNDLEIFNLDSIIETEKTPPHEPPQILCSSTNVPLIRENAFYSDNFYPPPATSDSDPPPTTIITVLQPHKLNLLNSPSKNKNEEADNNANLSNTLLDNNILTLSSQKSPEIDYKRIF